MLATAGDEHLDDPRSYKDSIDRPDHIPWREAMADEIESISQNGVMSLAELLSGKTAKHTR